MNFEIIKDRAFIFGYIKMGSYFAPAERATEKNLAVEIDFVSSNPVMSGLLSSISGVLAVLNEHRQIIALNDSLLKMLGIADPDQALGLRPGEVLQCIHAHDEPEGCGTTKFCSSCGAAIAIVSSLGQDKPVEKICALSASRGDKLVDIALLVKSHPIRINSRRFLLLFLQDVSLEQQRAALERSFFHDINNMLTMLVGASELLAEENPSDLTNTIHRTSVRLVKEVAIQRYLSQDESLNYSPKYNEYTTDEIIRELESFFISHPAARGKRLEFPKGDPAVSIRTDISLLLRVLSNMIINALEATAANDAVKVWIEHEASSLSFNVWNRQGIPEETANRIFQRNFSTKEQAGRGIGTYSMKLFGEEFLGGQVSFTTSAEEGTVFTFTLPV